jgi:hypothetical protein
MSWFFGDTPAHKQIKRIGLVERAWLRMAKRSGKKTTIAQ